MIRPLRDHIVVRPQERHQSFLAVVSHEKPSQGEVIAVGPDAAVEVGDTVRFGEFDFAPFRVDYAGERLLIMQDKDVAAVVENQ